MKEVNQNIILKKSFDFAVMTIDFSEILNDHKKWNLAKQLFRSGTSIGANIHEAQNAESLKDFIHKFKISAKETDETIYWLELCNKAESYPTNKILEEEAKEIKAILNRIITTSKNKLLKMNS